MGDLLRWSCGIVVGLVLIVAGAAKIAGPRRWSTEASVIGVPPVIVRLLPGVEVILGALVLVGVARPWPAMAALGLLIVFTVVLVRLVGREDAPSCACFGGWSSRRVGIRDVVRNAALVVAALIAVIA